MQKATRENEPLQSEKTQRAGDEAQKTESYDESGTLIGTIG